MSARISRNRLLGQVNAARAAEGATELKMSMEEHAELLRLACQAAAQLENDRARAGLAPAQPAPWPQSTWDFLKRHAPNARKSH